LITPTANQRRWAGRLNNEPARREERRFMPLRTIA
jgi:hypothetical protein